MRHCACGLQWHNVSINWCGVVGANGFCELMQVRGVTPTGERGAEGQRGSVQRGSYSTVESPGLATSCKPKRRFWSAPRRFVLSRETRCLADLFQALWRWVGSFHGPRRNTARERPDAMRFWGTRGGVGVAPTRRGVNKLSHTWPTPHLFLSIPAPFGRLHYPTPYLNTFAAALTSALTIHHRRKYRHISSARM